MLPSRLSGTGFRIRKGDVIGVSLAIMASSLSPATIEGVFRIEYDDGTNDQLSTNPLSVTTISDQTNFTPSAVKDGTVVSGYLFGSVNVADIPGNIYAKIFIAAGTDGSKYRQIIGQGYTTGGPDCIVGNFQAQDFTATWVFQGTVAEDATGGTHVCTLTVTPGVGNALQVMGGLITVGATATAQTATANIDDGTNVLQNLLNASGVSLAATGQVYSFPAGPISDAVEVTVNDAVSQSFVPVIVSGTMRIILKVQTAAVSVTQTFALVCRLKGSDLPTATLADTVGAPTLTINTNAIF